MTDWLSKLEQLDIPDGAVAGLSNADKPTIEGKLLQLSAGDRPLFFRGQLIDVLKRLRTLLPDTPAGQALHTALEALTHQPTHVHCMFALPLKVATCLFRYRQLLTSMYRLHSYTACGWCTLMQHCHCSVTCYF